MPAIVHIKYKQTGQSKNTDQYSIYVVQEKGTLFEAEKKTPKRK